MLLIIFHIIFSSIANLNVHTLSMFRVNLFNEKNVDITSSYSFCTVSEKAKRFRQAKRQKVIVNLFDILLQRNGAFFLFHEFTSKAELSRNYLPRKIYRSSPLITQYLTIFRSSSLAHLTPLGSKSFFNCLKHSVLIFKV